MKEKHQTQYWDSGVFVAYFNDEPGRADVVEQLLEEAHAGKITIITSSFAFVEVLRLKNRKRLTEKDEKMLNEFFQYPFIKPIDAMRGVCEAARHLIWKHPSLMPKDAVHLASAIEYASRAELDHLFSYDSDFTSLNGIVTTLFPICEPFVLNPGLFSSLPAPGTAPTPAPEASESPENSN